jgi:signal peptidase I
MNFNFELILFYAVVVTAIIALIDEIFWHKKRKLAAGEAPVKHPIIIDYARSFFPVLFIVFVLRSFLFEPFRIPSGSLEPTLLVGDFIVVNKYAYGIRLPVVHTKVYQTGEPQRGDIFVFRYPENPKVNFIKRVIGVPGDHISYTNKTLTINGQLVPQTFTKNAVRDYEGGGTQNVEQKEEDLLGIKHAIYVVPNMPGEDAKDIVVPPGMYFAMGDNRDNSADSRVWGFVPEANIVGKAEVVWLSWDSDRDRVRWSRFGKSIH